ncbi:unnamed protein product [Allacma fusca]|uniref:RNA polymerase II-associated protein 1 C-terminal domain-containing protein n=1 Tax=Allacma fusca TaxID=39272 RepID=A0A8J2LRA1_9HEXA|nr:unnamed protein product [Allacma fusca]
MEPDPDVKLEKIRSKFISTSGPVPPKPTPNARQNVSGDSTESTPRPKPKTKSKSIFAQRMAQKAENKKGGSSTRLSSSNVDITAHDKMAMEIQTLMQNIGVISANETVTSGDIIKMRENMMKSMNRSSLEFLKGRGSKKDIQRVKTDSNEKCEPGSMAKISKTESETQARSEPDIGKNVVENLPLSLQVKGVPHMNSLEIPKLEWTMNPDDDFGKGETPTTVPGDIQARFDLNGSLMDPKVSSDSTWLQGLHHHGDEMDKPGYTFEELLIYARSTTVSQRGFALHALAGIFKNSHEGVYDAALSINPLNLLTNVDVISVIRKSLDFDDMVTLDASFACLADVMFPTTEEECYDIVYLFPNAKPFLWHKVTNVNRDVVKDPATRDHQILTMDLLLFFIERSHLLDRIEYLLVDRPERVSQAVEINILRVLIRIARHSPDILLQSSRTLDRVCKIVMTGNWSAISAASGARSSGTDVVKNNPVAISVWLALKTFRVLVESSLENCSLVHSRYDIMPFILTYLATDYRYGLQSSSHAKLVILESFRFWCSSLDLGFGISEFNTIFPVLAINLRHFCDADALKNIVGFDGYYLAHLFHFLRCILHCGERGFEGIPTPTSAWSMVKDMEFFVLTITMNVLQILTANREDWALAVAGKGLEFLTTALKLGQLEHRKSAIMEHVRHLDLSDVTHSLQQHSIILNMSKIRSRYPSNYFTFHYGCSKCAIKYPSAFSLHSLQSRYDFIPWTVKANRTKVDPSSSRRYSKNPADLKKFLPLVIQETRSCLYFMQFLLLESIFTSSGDLISCYIHITQIFSMGEDVFLEPSIELLLGNILKLLVSLLEATFGKEPKPFTSFKPGPGLEHVATFKDYYGELVKEFESVSYCSNIFSAYLLLPLIPTESRETKLLFWSMQGLQFVRLELNNRLIPPDYLTTEVETDRALLQLYTILLVKTSTINRNNNELLFHVLDYHVTRGLPVEDMQKVMKLIVTICYGNILQDWNNLIPGF